MESIFEKHCVFITSTGRTGTQFLAKSLNQMIEDCYSVHEPANVFFKDMKKMGSRYKTIWIISNDYRTIFTFQIDV